VKSADKKYMNKDPQTYAIIGAAMEVHRQLRGITNRRLTYEALTNKIFVPA
jgi:hypothetical protein